MGVRWEEGGRVEKEEEEGKEGGKESGMCVQVRACPCVCACNYMCVHVCGCSKKMGNGVEQGECEHWDRCPGPLWELFKKAHSLGPPCI